MASIFAVVIETEDTSEDYVLLWTWIRLFNEVESLVETSVEYFILNRIWNEVENYSETTNKIFKYLSVYVANFYIQARYSVKVIRVVAGFEKAASVVSHYVNKALGIN